MLDVVRRTAEQVFIPVTVGGGIRSIEGIRATLGAGADKTSLNTAAVQHPELLRAGAEQFGAQCIVLAIDARANPAMPSGYEVFIRPLYRYRSLLLAALASGNIFTRA